MSPLNRLLRTLLYGMVPLGFGQWLIFADLPRCVKQFRSQSWDETIGTVDEAPSPMGLFPYRYEVAGKEFRGAGLVLKGDDQNALQQRAFLQIKKVIVVYDPAAPENSVLEKGLGQRDWWMLTFGAGGSLTGVVVCAVGIWEYMAQRFPKYSIQRRTGNGPGNPTSAIADGPGLPREGIRAPSNEHG
jgi:hypothetical protein